MQKTNPPASGPAIADVCTAAALYLMTQYARRPCPLVAHAIADQLARLGSPHDDQIAAVVRDLARSLLPQWRKTACDSGIVRH
ncbi:MAG: hypothetical protein ACO3F9_11670 [Burkholderiales bacterium]